MSKLNKIKINGFKAFPSKFELELGEKHLLVYGENGSGKSSIYWALHCLFNSIKKPDEGKKYFNSTHPQNLINKYFVPSSDTDEPSILVNYVDEGNNLFTPFINKNGCNGVEKLEELETCFINHQFLFSFFNFTNSKTVNLFPIFLQEIFQYRYDDQQKKYIDQIYDEIVTDAKKLGNQSSVKNINAKITYFNNLLCSIANEINLHASDLYNKYFKEEDNDKELFIKLIYPETDDLFDESNLTGYWVRYDYHQIIHNGIIKRAPNKSLNNPLIRLEIKEGVELINKPQTYFNEAKLTAIALSIRFSLLNLDNPSEGNFLALDDMLISLDMSNRTKVIDFLLSISDKYKIYLFTHDLNFYDLVKKKIDKEYKQTKDWVMGKIFMNDFEQIPYPEFIADNDKIEHAHQYLMKHDYPACGVYLRRECEAILDNILPETLKHKTIEDDGNKKTESLNLNDKILNLEKFCNIEQLDYNRFKSIKAYKDVILNTLAHNDSKCPIFKTELLALIKSLKDLQKIKRSENILKNGKEVSINLSTVGKEIAICVKLREKLLFLEDDGVKKISNYGKCEVTKIKENGADKMESAIFDSLSGIYSHYSQLNGIEASENLLDVTYYRGKKLREILP